MNETDTKRKIDFVTRTASGQYDSKQYMASIGGGMPMQLEGSTFFTPTVGLSYTQVESDKYTETGAGNLNLNIAADDVSSAVFNIGGKLATKIKEGSTTYTPELRAGLNYDMIGEEAVATGSFTGGGAVFKTTGAEVEELGASIGVGLTVDADDAVDISVNYDTDVKDGFIGHSASVEARFKF
jgi:outer membrane autotransporter protein